jgi:hypothetical protein
MWVRLKWADWTQAQMDSCKWTAANGQHQMDTFSLYYLLKES